MSGISREGAVSVPALFLRNENLAFAGMVGLAHNAFELHTLHQRGGLVVADLQPTLDVAGGSLAIAFDDCNGLRKQIAAAIATHAGGIEHRAVLLARLV